VWLSKRRALTSTQVEVLEAEAMKLTPEERARLADRLIASLSEDAEIEEAWAAEVERRIAEIEAGRAPVVPGADAIARARDALK
jgi:putative addiction module component (TIGR02574 family)